VKESVVVSRPFVSLVEEHEEARRDTYANCGNEDHGGIFG
jgi:hypothetical protein